MLVPELSCLAAVATTERGKERSLLFETEMEQEKKGVPVSVINTTKSWEKRTSNTPRHGATEVKEMQRKDLKTTTRKERKKKKQEQTTQRHG
jgi:hypothetical protein